MTVDSSRSRPSAQELAAASPEEKRRLLEALLREGRAGARMPSTPHGAIPALPSAPRPLSYAQKRLFFLSQLGHVGSSYNIPFVMTLRGPLDPRVLQACVARIVERHAVLRTRFALSDGEPVQRVGDPYVVPLDAHDPPRLPDGGVDEQALLAESAAVSNRVVDLADGRLLWGRLWRIGADLHRLLLVVHHIAFDGWSIGVMSAEISALYSAYSGGRPDPLPPLPIQYADYATWQCAPAQQQHLERTLHVRAAELGGLPVFQLPPQRRVARDGPAPAGLVRFEIPEALGEAAVASARRWSTTPFVLLLSVFEILLARRAGTSDVVIGSPIAGRSRSETEGLLGFFVNSLVIWTKVDSGLPLRACVERTAESVRAAMGAQELPFERLVEVLQPERRYTRNPIFQTMFAYQAPFRGPDFAGSEISLERFELDDTAARFDLEGHVWIESGRIHGGFFHNTDLFSDRYVRGIADDYIALLQAALAQPDEPVGRLTRAGAPSARPQATPRPAARPLDLPSLWAGARARAPHAVAVECLAADGSADRISLSYRELDRVASRLAARLHAAGVGPGCVVAVLAPRSLASTVAILAIVLAGAAYLPIDPAQPAPRRRAMLEAGAVRLLLRTPDAQCEDGIDAWVIDDRDFAIGPDEPGGAVHEAVVFRPPHPEELAYLNFTSGSTGQPKGIGITQRSAASFAQDTGYSALGQDAGSDVVPHLASIAFDATTFELWSTWHACGRVLVVPREVALDAQALSCALSRGKATTSFLTTALFNRMVEDAPQAFAGLRTLLFGGESASVSAVARCRALHPRLRLVHVYGPTETTTFACAREVGPVAPEDLHVPLGGAEDGGAVAGAVLRVVDAHGSLCGTDEVGELWIGGPGLAQGYIGPPALTAERFVPDPWSTQPGQRLYRSGDRVRRRADGGLEHLGRLDREVKVRGHRVDPAEIERALASHPRVARAAVGVIDEPDGGRALAAYVVEAATSPPAARDAGTDRTDDARVRAWEDVFDRHVYVRSAGDDPLFDISGWHRSDDRSPLGEPAMREWAGDVVAHALAGRPDSVLEIGCGTGMLLFQLAARARRYVGTDISARCLEGIRARIAERDDVYGHVRLHRLSADRLDELPATSYGDGFDLVLISSVAQYFPDGAYLEAVLDAALDRLRPGGRIVVADVRNAALRALFHAEMLAHPAQGVPRAARAAALERRLAGDTELFLDPGFFADWATRRAERPGAVVARVGLAEQALERDHELSRYRFAAVLERAGGADPASAAVCRGFVDAERVAWQVGPLDEASLGAALERVGRDPAAGGRDLPGWRGQSSGRHAALREAALEVGIAPPRAGPPMQALRACAVRYGFDLVASPVPGSGEALHDVVAVPRARDGGASRAVGQGLVLAQPMRRSAPDASLSSRPIAITERVESALRTHLTAMLPDYMVPAVLVQVDRVPTTPAGKVDFGSLAALRATDAVSRPVRAPTPTEGIVMALLGDLLGRPVHSPDDDFFHLGGHSLMASRLVARLRDRLDMDLPLDVLLRHPRIADMAAAIDALSAKGGTTREEGVL